MELRWEPCVHDIELHWMKFFFISIQFSKHKNASKNNCDEATNFSHKKKNNSKFLSTGSNGNSFNHHRYLQPYLIIFVKLNHSSLIEFNTQWFQWLTTWKCPWRCDPIGVSNEIKSKRREKSLKKIYILKKYIILRVQLYMKWLK